MTTSDVTEQHLAKEALEKALAEIKKSEDRLRRVIDTIPTLVWRAGPDGVPDFLSQPALDYTGLSLDQIWPRVIINLVMNGIEAMLSVTDRPRELMIRSRLDEAQQVLVSVTDCGVGISAENADRLFNAFFTTKSSGMGMGLSICRSIMEAHGGRLWTTANLPYGATFQFTLPVNGDTAS
jgi:signal transduction histidine kinase